MFVLEDSGLRGKYWQIAFKVELFVAHTALKAKIAWSDDNVSPSVIFWSCIDRSDEYLRISQGKEFEGPATVVFEDSLDQRGESQNIGRRLPADNLIRFED